MDQLLDSLIFATKDSSRNLDIEKIHKAWEFASLAHTGQKRLSGEDFISHPTQVATILCKWGLDTDTIVAGLLHDVIEEGGATRQDIAEAFGETIAVLVDAISVVGHIHLTGGKSEELIENSRKMILVMAKDLRVVLIKLADRFHNLQSLGYLPRDRQIRNAQETLEIYAPLAERLGIGQIKGDLEDMAFQYAFPEDYQKLVQSTNKLFKSGDIYIQKFKRDLLVALHAQIPTAVVNTRQKHMYSLWRKLQRPEHAGDLAQIHDIVATRILVDTLEECYLALGIVHGKYRPVPYLGMRDYIANPKPNGYRSIHTNVFGPEGRIVEIQIRTHDMHSQAEMGVAAHWQYAQAKSKGASDEKLEKGTAFGPTDKLSWVKQLAAWQQQMTDSEDYLHSLKFDALAHRNLVFSPIGDVYDLPRGATPIDYAYAVHTKLGHQAAGAKVNGRMVPLSHRLGNGDVVEILIDRKRKLPSHE
ncbi:MAG: RelA/SpoT family protein, partial [Patescibacteria group bacterium]